MGDLKDDMVTDLEDTFFEDTEFAEDAGTVIITHATGTTYSVEGIFDNEFQGVDPSTQNPIISTQPMIQINENDLQEEIHKNDKITVRGQQYHIYSNQPDGVGVVTLLLHKVMT